MTGLGIIVLTFTMFLPAATTARAAQDSTKPVATVNGQPIYEGDLMSAAGSRLLSLQNQEYNLKSDALDKLVLKKVVEVEAKKRNLTAEELFEQEVDSKIPEPSDEEARGYYLAEKNQTTLPFDQVKQQVKRILKAAEIQQARDKYAESLRGKADVNILLSPPRVDVAYDSARLRGNPDAPVTIVEFSDFQCPFCRKAETTMKNLLAEYNGRVKQAFRDFPMRTLHPQAELAAEAARCAGEQGKFWQFHDALFEADPPKLDQSDLAATARSLGLDEKAFTSCLAAGKVKAQIDKDVEDGTNAGVSGTPGFFINGVFVNGAQPQAEFEKIINRELAAPRDTSLTRASR